MSKLEFIKNIENQCTNSVKANFQVDTGKPKKFITFPYPYMNGRLHLGHAYTIQNADMQARYYASVGYNVMFPFAFHGSGMPIVACAKKLERELDVYCFNDNCHYDDYIHTLPKDSQIRILLEMDVGINEICNFVKPEYWIEYFSSKAKQDLSMFHVYSNFSRSFYTTEMNPYYDLFVRWQFSHLIKDGYVYQGTRDVIFSIKDNQPCADHDRHIGEGVKPIVTCCTTYSTSLGNLLVVSNSEVLGKNDIVIVCDKIEYVSFTIDGVTYIANKQSYDNIRHQYNTTFVGEVSWETLEALCGDSISFVDQSDICGTGFHFALGNGKHTCKNISFRFSEPNGNVVSRSGDTCIVAKTNQWFINYGDSDLKEIVKNYVANTFTCPDKKVHEMVKVGVDWLNEWACSRNFGLGTKIPNTNDIIDSLSDSTIYMAYYTIVHLITKIPEHVITNELFDYVFLPTNQEFTTGNTEYDKLVSEMKTEFNYWYPVDIRVSGKDLIQNHLTMALFNHRAIWKNDNYLPRSYYVNGYLLLNGEKMSKHTGNFLTMKGAIEKYGVSATRFALASNDGIEDGDFVTKLAESAIGKLHGEYEWILKNIAICSDQNEMSIYDKIFEHEICCAMKQADNAYKSAKYGSVINAFYAIINAKDEYKKYQESVKIDMFRKYAQVMITIMYPICTAWAENLKCEFNKNITHFRIDSIMKGKKLNESKWTEIEINWNIDYDIDGSGKKYKYYKNIISEVVNECFHLINKKKKQGKDADFYFEVAVVNKFTDTELQIIQQIGNLDPLLSTIEKNQVGKYKGFATFVKKNVEKYGNEWLNWVTDSNDEEFQLLVDNVPKMFNLCSAHIMHVSSDEKYMFKFGPSQPKVSIKQIMNIYE